MATVTLDGAISGGGGGGGGGAGGISNYPGSLDLTDSPVGLYLLDSDLAD